MNDNVINWPKNTSNEDDNLQSVFVVSGTNLVINKSYWFYPGGGQLPIGVVLVEDMTMHYIKCYMGTGTNVEDIARWGAKVPKQIAETLFGEIDNWAGI